MNAAAGESSVRSCDAARQPAEVLTDADRRALRAWRSHCRVRRGTLPSGVRPVRTRLIRAVGEGSLPDAGRVFVKVMGFPRWEDKIRYLFRRLPARHEADLLRYLRRHSIPCPEVLAVWTERALVLPRFSGLVTRGLCSDGRELSPADSIPLIRQLIAARVHHPDLHGDNFLGLADGRVAVLDVQSARILRFGFARRHRVAMTAKWLMHLRSPRGAAADLLEQEGVLSAAERRAAERLSEVLYRRQWCRRIERCFKESSDYAVSRGCDHVLYRRRAVGSDAGEWLSGGRELRDLWIGDRVREQWDGEPPVCVALREDRFRVGGRYRLQVLAPLSSELREALRLACARYREVRAGGAFPGTAGIHRDRLQSAAIDSDR